MARGGAQATSTSAIVVVVVVIVVVVVVVARVLALGKPWLIAAMPSMASPRRLYVVRARQPTEDGAA